MIAIEFEKLFERFDYSVNLNENGLTILTGPNGYGKTTILKSIEAVGNELIGIMYFFSLDFKKIKIIFDDDEQITIEKEKDTLKLTENNDSTNSISIKRLAIRRIIDEIMRRRPYFVRLNDDTWLDRRRGIKYSIDEYLMERAKEQLNYIQSDGLDEKSIKFVRMLRRIKRKMGDVYFIKEQRLIKKNKNGEYEQEIVDIIDELPNKIVNLIRSVQQDYSTISSKLDSTYPNRLFDNEVGITEGEYKNKINDMTTKFEKMKKYDLSTMEMTTNFIFKEEHAKALKIYFDDFNEKYSVYEDFIYKLELYTDIINNRLSFKSIRISKENGLDIVDDKGKKLKLGQLSSGEKQEIVLFYELIFGTSNNILLLIDEPEISLHIMWQKRFMDDLLRIIEYKGINVIVATHSPQIINNHWERQIDLGELYGKEFNKKQFE